MADQTADRDKPDDGRPAGPDPSGTPVGEPHSAAKAPDLESPDATDPKPDTPAAEAPSAAAKAAAATRAGRGDPGNEWTVSDGRGPLVTAAEDAETPGEPHPSPAGPEPADAPSRPAATASAIPEASLDGPETPPAEPAAAPRWPLAAALLIGAVIGAGSAAIVYRQSAGDAGADGQVASLSSRVDALEKNKAGSPDALRAAVADLQGKVAGLAKSPDAAAGLKPLDDKLAALQSEIEGLKARGAADKGLDGKVAALEGAVAGMKSATATTQAGVATVEDRQKALTDRVMMPALAVVADSLVQQIDHGVPYAAQVDALTSLQADPAKIAVLRQNADKGVPSAKVLAAGFEPLAEPIMATAHKAPPNAGFVDRLKSNMMSIVSVRRADDTSGDDLPSRVARIRADLAHDDVPAALATWDALPAEAKARGDAWAAKAKAAAEAISAARDLQHDAIVALAAKRS